MTTNGFPEGIITVLNTPFSAANRIDLTCLQNHARVAAAEGVAGFLIPGMAAEMQALDREERRDLVAAVREVCPEPLVVVGGAGGARRRDRLEVLEDLLKLGCRHILLQIPFDGGSGFLEEFRDSLAAGAECVMVQDWDQTGGGLPVDLIVELFDSHPQFQALKIETVPAGPKYSDVLARTGKKLHVSGGWAVMQMIEAMDRGVNAFMPTAMHRVYVEIFCRHRQGDRLGAIRLFERLLPVIAFTNQHLEVSIRFFKMLLHSQGLYATDATRLAAPPFDDFSRAYAREMIAHYLTLCEDLEQGRV